MRVQMDPKEPFHLRIKYNGEVKFDQVLQPGPHDINVEHPKCCGKAEAFLVEEDGTEVPIGSAEYGAQCQGADAQNCPKAQNAAGQ